MRTRNLFRYLLAALALLGNVSFVVAQQQTRITFDLQSGWYNGELTQVTATYNHDMPLEDIRPSENRTVKLGIPESNNGPFGGYYDQPGGQGTQYYKCEDGEIKSARKWDKTDATATLYAYWVSGNSESTNTYTVTLDLQDGKNGKDYVTATYGQSMPSINKNGGWLSVPTPSSSWRFEGYYTGRDGEGDMYYTPEMTSAKNWDKYSDATLYACWKYRVNLLQEEKGTINDVVYVNYNGNWPEAPIPTKTGYIFDGYYTINTNIKCYDSEMRSVNSWPSHSSGNIVAHWTPKTYSATIHYNSNDSRNLESTQTITAEINGTGTLQPSSEVCSREGYTLLGWSTTSNGNVVYHNNDSFSPRNEATDESKGNVYLYAIWQEQGSSEPTNTYTVTLDAQGGTGGSTSVTATLNIAMPSATAPTRTGYTFGGYFIEQNGAGTQYYNADMTSANSWDISANTTLYAKWTEENSEQGTGGNPNETGGNTGNTDGNNIYTVTLDAQGGKFYKNNIQGSGNITVNDGTVVFQNRLNEQNGYSFWGSDVIFNKPGYKLLGWYTMPQAEGDAENMDANPKGQKVYSVQENTNNQTYGFTAINETTNSKYWNSNGQWVGSANVTLYAHYGIIFEISNGDKITFKVMTPTNKISKDDVQASIDYAKTNAEKHGYSSICTIDLTMFNQEDNNNVSEIINVFEAKKSEENSIVSPNALLCMNGWVPGAKNVVFGSPSGMETPQCTNLVVTDRVPMKIPYEFKAWTTLYERNKLSEEDKKTDAMWQQSYNSVWGTLCLPYPIKNNQTYKDKDSNGNEFDYQLSFYELRNTYTNNQDQSYMQFYEMNDPGQVIPANTPVLYCRTKGVGSAVTVKSSVDYVIVPANGEYVDNKYVYKTTPINYSQVPLADESISDWRFVGTLEEKTLMASDYINQNATSPEDKYMASIYYFASNQFKQMNPDSGKLLVYPYRAYFIESSSVAESKVSSYSILVVDADGTTTDITNLIDNHEAKGNGKIYDLSGRRVKQPVKGSIYIVDGKKKMY